MPSLDRVKNIFKHLCYEGVNKKKLKCTMTCNKKNEHRPQDMMVEICDDVFDDNFGRLVVQGCVVLDYCVLVFFL